jgi:hypothetical protein
MINERVARSIVRRIKLTSLDLSGLNVLTEAATGPYCVTPVIAAAAGANVVAFAKSSRYGTPRDATNSVLNLAHELNVRHRIRITECLLSDDIQRADIVTNSGHLRPINSAFIAQMDKNAVIPLMFESWEFRDADIDLKACRERGIRISGTFERHANLQVFDYLGDLALLGLLQCNIPVAFSRILLICDNPFAEYLASTLLSAKAEVFCPQDAAPAGMPRGCLPKKSSDTDFDAIVMAMTPTKLKSTEHHNALTTILEGIGPIPAFVQIWGDVDRDGIPVDKWYPDVPPKPGHMGVLLSELGAEPIIRLQTGGLKAAEEMRRLSGGDSEYSQCFL